ncbi:MAG: hypothetical protein A3G38_03405 [Omnitrophica WOR_2 bacterium RIFCSPLOWO2_12_FULL_51_8]|nr:MAG: hypothetical protein A3G38_03405 [Omnitrophica WOR_2 bacterium RIFCSPLOWO2_12_FULL_51_8]
MDNREALEKFGLYDPRFEHDSCGVGFVCDIRGRKSHTFIRQGLEVLTRLSHRGATGADPKTGDGAGLLIQMPHEFFAEACARSDIALPGEGAYGAGLVFLPAREKERRFCKGAFLRVVKGEGQTLLGWRRVPVDESSIGKSARESQPVIEQVFIGRAKGVKDGLAFERKLYVIRKQLENIIRASKIKEKSFFYITNLSSRTISYKGLLMPGQLEDFFPDLKEEKLQSAL